MGHYHRIVNLTQRSALEPFDVGVLDKLLEFGDTPGAAMGAVWLLLGREAWCGDRVAILGYEGRPGDLAPDVVEETGIGHDAYYDGTLSSAGELARAVLVERGFCTFTSEKRESHVSWRMHPADRVEPAGRAAVAVDLDRREVLDPLAFGDDRDLHLAAAHGGLGGVTTALALLLAASNKGGSRGGGDFRSRDDVVGSWAGDHVGVVPAASVRGYHDISPRVRSALVESEAGAYDVKGDLVVRRDPRGSCVRAGREARRSRGDPGPTGDPLSVAADRMIDVSVLPTALTYGRLLDDSAAWRLLRAHHAPVIAAVLSTHLGKPGERRPAEDLHELVDSDLEQLRDHVDLPKTGRAYCDDWRNAGFLVRRPAIDSRGETLELSPEAVVALRVIAQLDEPRSSVTQSRLLSLAQALRQLSIDTDPDASRRLAALRLERDRIEAEIARVGRGESEVLDERQSAERVTDILMQAQDLPGDFAGVRARFERLNQELRARILDSDGHGNVLDDVFRGVDLIESSDEGQTFSAFLSLIRDPERSAALEADVSAVLDREFARRLDPSSRRTLRSLVRDLKHGSREVHGVLTEFARGLRRYVYSQEFHRERAMRDALQAALAAAVPASRDTKPYAVLPGELELSSARLATIGEAVAHDPSDFDTGATLAEAAAASVDLATLAAAARESEIDFAELVANVNLALGRVRPATVADVLDATPATQGVASVVGLLSLAIAHGEVDDGLTERVTWSGADGVERQAEVTVHAFTKELV